PYRDGPFSQDLMHKAFANCHDYNVYLENIKNLAAKHPETELFLLLYHEVIMAVGAEKLAAFCKAAGIRNIISGDLHDEQALALFRAYGVKLARAVNYQMKEDDIQRCINTDGFTYMQAFLTGQQTAKPGFEKLSDCISYLRERKVSEPIYCGADIKDPGDARRVKEAGGNGFFVGSSIISLYDQPEKLVELIKEYKQSVLD
ncbi:MAG: tryptophan synthase subunit alpha, partial [Oscillospiraceae bacterium]